MWKLLKKHWNARLWFFAQNTKKKLKCTAHPSLLPVCRSVSLLVCSPGVAQQPHWQGSWPERRKFGLEGMLPPFLSPGFRIGRMGPKKSCKSKNPWPNLRSKGEENAASWFIPALTNPRISRILLDWRGIVGWDISRIVAPNTQIKPMNGTFNKVRQNRIALNRNYIKKNFSPLVFWRFCELPQMPSVSLPEVGGIIDEVVMGWVDPQSPHHTRDWVARSGTLPLHHKHSMRVAWTRRQQPSCDPTPNPLPIFSRKCKARPPKNNGVTRWRSSRVQF